MGARSPDTKIEAPLVQPTFKESRQTPHWVRFDYCPLLHILSADHQFDCGVWDHFLRLPHFLDRSWLNSYLYPIHLLSIQPCFESLQWVPGPWILDHWASPPIWLSIGFHLLSMASLSRKRSWHNICESGRSPLNGKVSMKASVVKKDHSTIFICGICTKLKFKVTLGEFNFHEITNEQLEMVPLWDQY